MMKKRKNAEKAKAQKTDRQSSVDVVEWLLSIDFPA